MTRSLSALGATSASGGGGRKRRTGVPAPYVLDVRSDEADELLDGLELLGNAEIAPLKGAEQAARLAVIAGTGLDPWDAHVAAVADAANGNGVSSRRSPYLGGSIGADQLRSVRSR
jgi:hypothetical protein